MSVSVARNGWGSQVGVFFEFELGLCVRREEFMCG